MANRARLKINSVFYEGWKAFSIQESIETIASGFRLSLTDSWGDVRWPIRDGDLCEVYIDEEKLLTGYVDSIETGISKDERTIEVSGRSKASDIVDCSLDGLGTNEFTGLKLEKLCEKLAAPFGIVFEVPSGVDTGPVIQKVTANIGDTVFEVIEKRVRQKGLLLISTPEGIVQITTPGKEYATSGLVLGQNIISCNASFDSKERFSTYKVKAQNNYELDGPSGFQILGRASDPNVTRFRPLVLQAANAMTNAEAKTRAEFEATTRAARARRVSVTVQGFKQSDGSLWKKNKLVRLIAPALGVENEELLISDISYSQDENGSFTTFGLKRKDAYIPVPEVEKKDEIFLGGDE